MRDHWTLDDIRWQDFDRSKLDPETLRAVKAAAMVESNAADYVTYLCNVFADRPDLKDVVRQWGEEECQHGRALARWAELADPDFNYAEAFKRFQDGYSIPKDAEVSVRGSRAGEMIARCVVESGTSSFYSAIRDATDEPVLKDVAARIAADEFRHYKLFYDTFRTLEGELPSRFDRARIAYGRVSEADDDELAYAYYAANVTPGSGVGYDRKTFAAAYEKRALSLYRRRHVDRLVSMITKAVGLSPQGYVTRALSSIVWIVWRARTRRLASAL